MALYDGFFDAYYNEETGEYDRSYGSSDFTRYFGQMIGSGVCVAEDPDSCKVRLEGNRALVNMGYLFIRGYWLAVVEEPYAVDLTGTGPLAVTACLNTGKKMIEVEAVPAAESYPVDTLVLALVDPVAGTAEDTRYDTGICGVIDSAGGLSDKAAFAIDYINKEIGPKFEQIEAEIAAQETRLDGKIEEVGRVVEKIAPLPVGTIKFSANPDMGEEWLRCDGRFISKEEYPELVDMLLNFSDGNSEENTFNFYWTATTLPSSANWYSVTYGNGKFVAVAGKAASSGISGNVAAYSDDGINWTAASLPPVSSTTSWSSVTYGNGKFVVVAGGRSTSNVAAYSTDGINWSAATLPSTSLWYSVTYGDRMFVAISIEGYLAYSNNGISWVRADSLPGTYRNWYSVTYGNGVFVAVAGGYYSAYGDAITYHPSNSFAYSQDGINWTYSTLPSSTYWHSVTYGNGMFVAISGGYNPYNSYVEFKRPDASKISAYSRDGINWSAATLPTSAYWQSITYGNGIFVAIAYNSSLCAYSKDGINWQMGTLPFSGHLQDLAYGEGKFVVANSLNEKSAYAAPFDNAKLPTLSLSNIPAYIKAKEPDGGEAGA